MNYIPLKEIVSSLQNIPEQSTVESQPAKKIEISKKTLILISIGLISVVLSLGIPLGVVVQTNHYEAKLKKDLASYIHNLPDWMGLELLESAVLHNNPDILEFLLKTKNKTEIENEDFVSDASDALFLAVELDKLQMAESLIKSGANLSTKNGLGETPIHLASSAKMIKLLIDHGSDPNDQDVYGRSALHKDKDVETIIELIENGADINAKNEEGVTALMAFASYGKPEVVTFLIQNGAKVDDVDNKLRTPLHHASKGESDEKNRAYIAEILLQNQAKVDATDKYYNETSLHYACRNDALEVVKKLIKYGANPNAPNVHYETPIFETSIPEIVTVLLQNGANLDHKNKEGNTRLCEVAKIKYTKMTEALLKNGADPNIFCMKNSTALQLATDPYPDLPESAHLLFFVMQKRVIDRTEIMELLLKNGARVDVTDQQMQTPLHYVACKGNPSEAKILINYGADVHAKSTDGKTPLDVAIDKKNEDVINFLKQYQ